MAIIDTLAETVKKLKEVQRQVGVCINYATATQRYEARLQAEGVLPANMITEIDGMLAELEDMADIAAAVITNKNWGYGITIGWSDEYGTGDEGYYVTASTGVDWRINAKNVTNFFLNVFAVSDVIRVRNADDDDYNIVTTVGSLVDSNATLVFGDITKNDAGSVHKNLTMTLLQR